MSVGQRSRLCCKRNICQASKICSSLLSDSDGTHHILLSQSFLANLFVLFFTILKDHVYMCAVYVTVCACDYRCLWRPEKGAGHPGTGVTSSQQPNKCAGNQTLSHLPLEPRRTCIQPLGYLSPSWLVSSGETWLSSSLSQKLMLFEETCWYYMSTFSYFHKAWLVLSSRGWTWSCTHGPGFLFLPLVPYATLCVGLIPGLRQEHPRWPWSALSLKNEQTAANSTFVWECQKDRGATWKSTQRLTPEESEW